MKSTFAVLFYLRKNRTDKNGQVPLMAKITINGERTQFGINLKIQPDQWDSKSSRAIGRSAEATNLNRLLDSIRVKAEQIYQKQLIDKGYVQPEYVKNTLLGLESEQSKKLIEIFTEHNKHYKEKIGKNTSEKTYGRYELTKERLRSFLKFKYNLSDIPLSELNKIFVEAFYIYLRDEHTCNNNTAMKFVQRFRTAFNFARDSGIEIKVDPFANFDFKFEEVEREILTEAEISTLYNKKFKSARLTKVRDIFVFCCYTDVALIRNVLYLRKMGWA